MIIIMIMIIIIMIIIIIIMIMIIIIIIKVKTIRIIELFNSKWFTIHANILLSVRYSISKNEKKKL